jgi:hypothetical protein
VGRRAPLGAYGPGYRSHVRVLVSSTGGAGHLGPLLPFADALADAGHEVLFVVPPELQASVAGSGHAFELGASPPARELAPILARLPQLAPDEAAVIGNRDMFGRLWTAAMRPALERTVAEWRPDLVVREPCQYAAAIAAERHRVRHAQVAISLAEVEWRSLELAAPVLGDDLVSRLRASPYLSGFPAPLDPSPSRTRAATATRPPHRHRCRTGGTGALIRWSM